MYKSQERNDYNKDDEYYSPNKNSPNNNQVASQSQTNPLKS